MSQKMNLMPRLGFMLLTLTAVSDTVAGAPGVAVPNANLQVLPVDISKHQLLQVMKLVARSLGVTCSYCHQSGTRDYATDELQPKRVARNMMRLAAKLHVGTLDWRDPPPTVCLQCHDCKPIDPDRSRERLLRY